MDDGVVNDPDQLRKNLAEYNEQLQEVRYSILSPTVCVKATEHDSNISYNIMQVEELLLSDPNNAEYKEIYAGLEEVCCLFVPFPGTFLFSDRLLGIHAQVIHLTKELLEASNDGTTASGPGRLASQGQGEALKIVAAITEAPEVKVPSVLPPQIKDQIRIAQQRAALAGHAPVEWAIGAQVQAKFSGDGTWYDAVVTAISTAGRFIVTYSAYGTQDEVGIEDVRNIEEQYQTKDGNTEYKGLSAPKLNTVRDASTQEMNEPPAWMQIKPSDNEKTKQKKKKLLKSFKSKQRFQRMDAEQKKKADSWKNFLSSKISKKKSKTKL